MNPTDHETIKTTTPIQKILLNEIDQINPFKTRKEFFEEACRQYLQTLKRQKAYEQLEKACRDSADEDLLENDEWESVTLEAWK